MKYLSPVFPANNWYYSRLFETYFFDYNGKHQCGVSPHTQEEK